MSPSPSEPVPSKECDCCKDGFFPFCPCGCHQRAAAQRVAHAVSMEEQVEHLRRENVRWENAHKILLAEIERLKRPAHEREPPHCSTCACGLAPEPAAEQIIQCPNCAMPMRVPASSQPPACQHDQTKPGPTLVPLGSAAHGSSDWLWACTVCNDRMRMPVAEAHGAAQPPGDGR